MRKKSIIFRIGWLTAVFLLPLFILSALNAQQSKSLPPTAPFFTQQTTTVGLTATHTISDTSPFKYFSVGQAWSDFNNDSWPDLFLTDQTGPNSLWINHNGISFTLSPLSNQLGLTTTFSGGASWADYDNDGWQDLYLLSWGSNQLFHNENGTSFTDVTAAAGVGDTGKSETASWGDYDKDGFLDLYVANWGLQCDASASRCDYAQPPGAEGNRDRLYHNNGDGTFTDVTTMTLGITQTLSGGFVASFVDFDNDNDLDIYLVNDSWVLPSHGNILWRNDGPGCAHWCFTDISKEADAGVVIYGMGLATGDYDRDGDLDFYMSNCNMPCAPDPKVSLEMVLLNNQGDGTFTDTTSFAGVHYGPGAITWGTLFADVDLDGWLDLYMANSNMNPATDMSGNPLFMNNGDGTFTDAGLTSGAFDQKDSMGIAYADYDRDGDIDFLVGNYQDGYELYQNNSAGQEHNWLEFELIGHGPINRDAIGTRIYLTDSTGATQLQELKNGASMGAGHQKILHFGLGTATAVSLRIIWPDGTEQTITNLPTNEIMTLEYALTTYLPLLFK